MRGKRDRIPQSITPKKILKLSFGSSEGGLDLPGLINYEVFLFSKTGKQKSKPGLVVFGFAACVCVLFVFFKKANSFLC